MGSASLNQSAHAEAYRGLVFGSYLNEAFAQMRAGEVVDALGGEVRVVAMDAAGARRYRVVVIGAEAELRTLRQRARQAGLGDSWATDIPAAALAGASQVGTASPDTSPPPVVTPAAPAVPPPPVRDEAPPPAQVVAELPAPVTEVAPDEEVGLVGMSSDGTDVVVPLTRMEVGSFDFELDGRLDESFWQTLPWYDNMRVIDPDTLVEPRFETRVRWFYTDRGMYVGVHMQQPPESLLARLSSRDEFLNRDSFGLTLDTSGEGLYGYWFTINLGGSVMDGKVAPERQFSDEWDGPWQSATAELDDGWSTEFYLPWSMMSMPQTPDGNRKLGFWVNRKVAYIDERYGWPALPFQAPRFMSALATMETPGIAPRQQFEVYPNVSYTYDEITGEDEYRGGLDLSWRPSTNMQLTATLNPDFGVVESDDVVVNLSSFETFFPEKRLFFLEGREVFQTTPRSRVRSRSPSGVGSRQTTSTFSPEPTTLLNTRRIGGPPQVDVPANVDIEGVELGKPSDLLGAAKLTGQAGGLRYGVLGAVEDDGRLPGTIETGPNAGDPTRVEYEGRDFGVARILYETTGAGRQSIGYLGTMVRYSDYEAVVHGVDGHWLSPNGLWNVDGQLVHSDVDEIDGQGVIADVTYRPKIGVEHVLALDWLDEDLDVRDLGFIRRNDSRNIIYRYSFSTGRDLKFLRGKRRSVVLSNEWNQDGRHVRAGYFFRNGWTFKNLSEVRTEFDFFPGRWDDRNSFGNGDFKTEDRFVAEIGYGTDTSKPISVSVLAGARQEELGGWTKRYAVGMTFKPNDRFSMEFDVNYFDRDGWLLHQRAFGRDDPTQDNNMTTFFADEIQPRLAVDWFLSAKQQLRFTLQWAGIDADEKDFYMIPAGEGDLIELPRAPGDPVNDFTVSRITAQLRYRWEIGPLSDLFVVYTRGSNVPTQLEDDFGNLFTEAISEPIVDVFVVKLRYRFGL